MLEIDHRVIAIRGDVSAASKIHLTVVLFAIDRLKGPIDIRNRATHQVQILGDHRCCERDDQSHAGLLISDPSSGGQNFQPSLVHRGPWSSGIADQAILASVHLHPGKEVIGAACPMFCVSLGQPLAWAPNAKVWIVQN